MTSTNFSVKQTTCPYIKNCGQGLELAGEQADVIQRGYTAGRFDKNAVLISMPFECPHGLRVCAHFEVKI